LRAVGELSKAGVPVTVMVAPIIPGLNDSEIPAILQAAQEHGASYAGYVMLRLPLTVKPVFLDWLKQSLPTHKNRIESLIRSTRDGQLNQTEFRQRLRGTGEYADHINRTFSLFARRFGLDRKAPPLDVTKFRKPTQQGTLFDLD
jgi:DNA repair photolyase